MKSTELTFVLLLLGAGGLVIVIALFGIAPLVQAQATPAWSIPARLQPKNGIYAFDVKGYLLNSHVKPLTEPRLSPDGLCVTLQDTPSQHQITHGAVPGIVLDAHRVHSSQVFFMEGWKVRITRPVNLKAYLRSGKDIDLQKSENDTFALPQSALSDTFTLEIIADNIEAELLLQPNSSPQDNNPIRLTQKRGPTGSRIECHLQEEAVKPDGKSKINVLFFLENARAPLEVASIDVNSRPNEHGLWGKIAVPELGKIWSRPLKAVVLVTHESGEPTVKIDEILVTRKWVGVILGLLAVTILLVVIRISNIGTKKWTELEKWKQLKWGDKFFRFPLHFAVTPLNRYSISLAQILLWTLVVIFAFIYIAWVRGEFLEITSQMLILLGISGTTAIASKAAAMARVREIPDEYMDKVRKDQDYRIPRFRDLVSIGDFPSIFKLQIFAFTVLAMVQVIRQILHTGNFPELRENLLVLMGISGGAYIANELTTENVWKKLEDLIKKINNKKGELLKAESEQKTNLVQALQKDIDSLESEVKRLLKDIFTEDRSGGGSDVTSSDTNSDAGGGKETGSSS